MERLLNTLLPVFSILGAICGSLLVWAFFLETPFLSYQNLPFPPDLSTVRPGQVMPLTVERCSTARGIESYTVTHELRNERADLPAITMPAMLVTVQPGCHKSISLVNLVPAVTPAGVYRIHGVAIVQGSIKSFAVPWSSQPFEVAP